MFVTLRSMNRPDVLSVNCPVYLFFDTSRACHVMSFIENMMSENFWHIFLMSNSYDNLVFNAKNFHKMKRESVRSIPV